MYSLKKKVRNKACVEGSIAEAYLKEEMVTFCSLYLDEDFETQFTKKSRNFDGGDVSFYDSLSIFSQPGRATNAGRRRYVSDEEYHSIMSYILTNCKEVEPYLREFEEDMINEYVGINVERLARLTEEKIVEWFRIRMTATDVVDQRLRILSRGFNRHVTVYKNYIVNNYRFTVNAHEGSKRTKNSGVMLKGSTINAYDMNWYGVLTEILEIDFYGDHTQTVMFKVDWYDNERGMKVDRFHTVEVNTRRRLNCNEPFIFAYQAHQVCYLPKISQKNKEWKTVIRTEARTNIDILENEESITRLPLQILYVNDVDEFVDVRDDNDDDIVHIHQQVRFEEEVEEDEENDEEEEDEEEEDEEEEDEEEEEEDEDEDEEDE